MTSTAPKICPDSLLSSDKYFRCEKYEATMSKASCIQRQKYAKLPHPKTKYNGHHKIVIRPSMYAGCLNCAQGKRLAEIKVEAREYENFKRRNKR